jgi:hypothetical protein
MVFLGRTVALGLALASLCGCLKTPPKVQPVTAMAMPSPPAHVLIPVVLTEPTEPAPVEPEPPAATSAPNRPPRAGNGATRPAERPATTAATPEPAPPPPALQTTADGRQADAIRSKVFDAEQKLNALNLRELNVSARAQVEQARGFIRMANEALKIKNYLYAEQLARKAAAVANQLGN